jgi:NAD(P)-dependent dehydrogenase (short-subunit alcohol dehydrogenase family)
MDSEFVDRRVLITGGASGIGRAIATAFAERGAEVVILSPAELAHADEVKYFAGAVEASGFIEDLRARGFAMHLVEGDAAQSAAIERAVALADSLGGVDVLICNAATNTIHSLLDHDPELWRRIIDVNLIGPFLAIRACLPGMLARGFGRIVSILSVAAHDGLPGYSAYCASKHGLLGLHRAAAREVERADVTLATVSPGLVDTPSAHMHHELAACTRGIAYEQLLADALAESHQQRLIAPEEVADLVVYVCRCGQSLHGADVPITAGWVAG